MDLKQFRQIVLSSARLVMVGRNGQRKLLGRGSPQLTSFIVMKGRTQAPIIKYLNRILFVSLRYVVERYSL